MNDRMENPIDSERFYGRCWGLGGGDEEDYKRRNRLKQDEDQMFKWCVNSRGEIKFENLVW